MKYSKVELLIVFYRVLDRQGKYYLEMCFETTRFMWFVLRVSQEQMVNLHGGRLRQHSILHTSPNQLSIKEDYSKFSPMKSLFLISIVESRNSDPVSTKSTLLIKKSSRL